MCVWFDAASMAHTLGSLLASTVVALLLWSGLE